MKISIVVPTFRRREDLRRLLESITRQDFPCRDYEVIVVSNLPDLKTKNMVDGFRFRIRNLSYLEMDKRGVNKARNAGLVVATGKIVYFLDDDCEILSPEHLSKLYQLHEIFSEITAIGGAYLLPQSSSRTEEAYHAQCTRWMLARTSSWAPSWRLVGGNVSYKREHLSSGDIQFNPEIGFGGSETEMHARLCRMGYQAIFHSGIPVVHHCRLNLLGLVGKAIFQGAGAGRLQFTLPEAKTVRIEAGPTFWSKSMAIFF